MEWANAPDRAYADRTYTVVTALSATSVTFAHIGRDADGALAAARYASELRARQQKERKDSLLNCQETSA